MAPLLLAGWVGLEGTASFPEDCTVGFTCTVGLAFASSVGLQTSYYYVKSVKF